MIFFKNWQKMGQEKPNGGDNEFLQMSLLQKIGKKGKQ